MKYAKHKHLYIGVDLHKNTHTATIINCWNEILGEITFENRPSAFYKLIDKVNECLEEGIKPIFALEDTGSYGRSLAVYLKEGSRIVKEVNPALAHAQRMSNPNVKKNDNWDAFCVATVLLNNINTLPDADPKDFYWTLKQLVLRRNGITFELTNLKNRLHQQLTCHYPSYGKFLMAYLETLPYSSGKPIHVQNTLIM